MNFKNFSKYLKDLIPVILTIYLFIFGIIWISLHLYIRFIMERPSYVLEDIKPFLTLKHYVFFACFIVMHAIVIIAMLITIYKQRFPHKRSSRFVHISEKVTYLFDLIYWKPLGYIHDHIAPYIPMSGNFFLYIEKIWSKKNPIYFYILIFFFDLLPRLVLSTIFLIEVIIFDRLEIFLSSISIILITLTWHIFLKLFASFGERNLPVIKVYFLKITGLGDPILDESGNVISYPRYEFIVKPEYDGVINVAEEVNLLLQLEAIPRFVEQIKKDTAKIIPSLTILTSFMFVIGGLYRLIFLIV